MEMKATPGPWDRDGLTIKTSRGIIAECPLPQKFGVYDCQENAHLISAAPDLYEALEALLATHKQGRGQCCAAADMAIDALAKARGES